MSKSRRVTRKHATGATRRLNAGHSAETPSRTKPGGRILEGLVVSIVAGILVAFPIYLSRVKITLPNRKIEAYGSPPLDFTLINDGIFDIYDADLLIYLAKYESMPPAVVTLNGFPLGPIRIADRVARDSSADLALPLIHLTAVKQADVTLVVRYRPGFTWCCSYFSERFVSGVDLNGDQVWYQQSSTEDPKALWR